MPAHIAPKSFAPKSFMQFSRLSCCLVGLLSLELGACSAAGEVVDSDGEASAADTGELQQPIVGGATDREHVAVLAIASITPDSEALCSGTLIAPNLVLTARHCVVPVESEEVDCKSSKFPAPYTPDALWVSPSTLVRGASLFPVREIAVPDDDGALCGADIALLILDGQFNAQIAPIAPRLDTPTTTGEAFTAVGFGEAHEQGGAGTRRALANVEVVCGADDCGAPDVLTRTEFLGEQAVCEGDSGGPALDANDQVVGVASRTGQDCTWAIYSAVSPWRDWIVGVAKRAVTIGDYSVPSWLTTAEDQIAAGDSLGVVSGTGGDVLTPVNSGTVGVGDGDVAVAPTGPALGDIGGTTVPSASHADSGCAIGAAGSSSGSSVWLGALGAALVSRLRRREAGPRKQRA
jgi:Trypsin